LLRILLHSTQLTIDYLLVNLMERWGIMSENLLHYAGKPHNTTLVRTGLAFTGCLFVFSSHAVRRLTQVPFTDWR
jgi:hypothetical protein